MFFINESKIVINKTAKIRPGCILDANKGPIIIDENVLVDIGSKIQGPVYIDKNSYISPGAKIRSMTLIGPGCKVGGEISNSIFHANSNKVHDGFLGHCYVGEWVNIGAGTNNSNLKNNYSNIKFIFKDKQIDTERIFLGSMIGDFVRIGISTMLNTGTYIGIGSNVFGAGFQNKFIAPFSGLFDDQYRNKPYVNVYHVFPFSYLENIQNKMRMFLINKVKVLSPVKTVWAYTKKGINFNRNKMEIRSSIRTTDFKLTKRLFVDSVFEINSIQYPVNFVKDEREIPRKSWYSACNQLYL